MKKCGTIYGNISISQEILETLLATGVSHYTQWPRLVGVGPVTGPRLDSHVWPGANTCFQTVVEAETAERLLDALQALRDSPAGKRSGLFAFSSPVDRELV
jgi:hypothetical protein